jgi:predicted secreted protein
MMAAVNSTRGVKLVLKVGDGASPEVFTALCTINAERGLTFNAQTNDATIPDCADPDAIAFLAREKTSLSVDFTGGGMSDKSNVKTLWDWWESDESKNCQIILDDDNAANRVTFEGAFHLTQFDLTGNRGEKVNSTMTLASDGIVTAEFGANVGGS